MSFDERLNEITEATNLQAKHRADFYSRLFAPRKNANATFAERKATLCVYAMTLPESLRALPLVPKLAIVTHHWNDLVAPSPPANGLYLVSFRDEHRRVYPDPEVFAAIHHTTKPPS